MSHSLSFFQKIYIINLASRADRRREMAEQFERVGLTLASDGVEVFEAIRPADAGSFPSVGSRGCFLSHLGVLKAAAAGGMSRILILEDDVNFAADFLQRMPLVVQGLQNRNWSIFHGGYRLRAPIFPEENGIARVSPEDDVECLHFVGLDAPVFDPLITYLEAQLTRAPGHPEGGPMHVDGSYNLFRRAHPEFETWLAVPELGYQRASRTDIHPLQWRDRAWGVRNAMSLLRSVKNR